MSCSAAVRLTICVPPLALVKLLVVLTAVKLVLVFTEPLAKLALPKAAVPVALVVMAELVVVSNTLSETEPLVVIVTLALLITALLVPILVLDPPTKV